MDFIFMEEKKIRNEKKHLRAWLAISCLMVLLVSLNANADLIGLWRFDEGDGNDVSDSSGYGNHGVAYASPWHKGLEGGIEVNNTDPRWIARGTGYALEFGTMPDGAYPDSDNKNWNYVFVERSNELANLGPKWTIAVWIKQYVNDPTLLTPLGGYGYQRVISCPHYEFELGIPGDMHDYFWPYYDGATGDFDVAVGTTQATGSWYHVALVYDGTDLIKYVNGDEQGRVNKPGKLLPNTFDIGEYLRFGAQTLPVKDYFIGALDDVAIFNQALSETQVETIMDGDFEGPWVEPTYESDQPTTFIWDSSFIAQKDTIVLNLGDKRKGGTGIPSWNWQMEGEANDPNYYGLVNAGLWDSNALSIEYAAYATVGDIIAQPKTGEYGIHWRIHKNTKYDLKARFGGENAINNVIGVKFYAADVNDSNNKTLLADLNKTITANETWYELSTTFLADEENYPSNDYTFKVECYINEGTGNPRGTAFGWFDFLRVDVNEFLTCEAYYYYHYGQNPELPYDFVKDCRIDFKDYAVIAGDWASCNNPEPAVSATELLTNSDFYEDIDRVPNNNDSVGGAPTGWSFEPATSDPDIAGIWNLDRNGKVNSHETGDYQPAGGSVVAYIDPNTELRQTVTSPTIQNGQTYYLSAMLGGSTASYQHVIDVTWEYVDNPISPTVVTEITSDDPNYYVLPTALVWRKVTTKWTADGDAAGKYFRVKVLYEPLPVAEPNGWGLIGYVSIDTTKPSGWPRQNLLTNGDFEDVSNLSEEDQYKLLATENDWAYFAGYDEQWPPGWTFNFEDDNLDEGGLQCMLWAPPAQPVQGRVSLWLGDYYKEYTAIIEQKVTSETIQSGQTYYLDFVGSITSPAYNEGTWTWPSPDPNLVVELYWLKPGQDDIHSGNENSDWGRILTLKATADGSLGAMGGHWQTAQTSFTASSSLAGRSFFVRAYGEPKEAPYAYFEEIYLSKEPPPTIGAYTCYELRNKFGEEMIEVDLNGNCDVDIDDIGIFVEQWLECNDPQGCP